MLGTFLLDEVPLPEKTRIKFQKHRKDLIEELSLSGHLLDNLLARGCISDEHMAAVRQRGGTQREQIGRLLDIIESRSFAHYKQFLSVLRETGQEHVADCLETDGGLEDVEMVLGQYQLY